MKVVTYLGSLVQLCCGEGGTLQANITGMCGECSECLGHTGFAPTHGVCAFPVYTAQAPGWSAGELSKASPGLCALPRSKPLGFLGTPQRHRLGWACDLCPSQVTLPGYVVRLFTSLVPAAWFPGCTVGTLSYAMCLPWGADFWLRPSWQMLTVQNPRKTWLATGSLLAVW